MLILIVGYDSDYCSLCWLCCFGVLCFTVYDLIVLLEPYAFGVYVLPLIFGCL